MVESVQTGLSETGFLQHGDHVVIVAGNPGRHSRQTNSLRVYEMD
jgi:pyruvate kinase